MERRQLHEENLSLKKELAESQRRAADLESQLLRRSVLQADAAERKRSGWRPAKTLNGVAKIFGLGSRLGDRDSAGKESGRDDKDKPENGGTNPLTDSGEGEAVEQVAMAAHCEDLEAKLADATAKFEALSKRALVLEGQVDPLRKLNDQLKQEAENHKTVVAQLEELASRSEVTKKIHH